MYGMIIADDTEQMDQRRFFDDDDGGGGMWMSRKRLGLLHVSTYFYGFACCSFHPFSYMFTLLSLMAYEVGRSYL